MQINELEKQVVELKRKVGSIEGKIDMVKEIISNSNILKEECENNKEIYQKSIEIVNYVQEQSRDKVKDAFEQIVTYALKFIYSSDYEFGVEFDRRGNLGTMNFNIKTPQFKELASPYDTSGGGVLDICALSLRMVLLQFGEQQGSIILDESLKHLSIEYRENASKFLYEISRKLNRQIIFITHQQTFIDNAENALQIN